MASGLEEFGIVDDSDATAVPNRAVEPGPRVAAAPPDVDRETRARLVQKLLGGMGLFEGLLPVHLHRIAKLAQDVEVKRGDYLFHHGDRGDGLYLVVEGAIRISRNVAGIGEEALAIVHPGMYFGEMSIVDDEMPRSADAIGHENTRLLRLPKDDLRDLMFVDRELAYELLWRFIRTLSARLRESNDRLLMLTVSSKF